MYTLLHEESGSLLVGSEQRSLQILKRGILKPSRVVNSKGSSKLYRQYLLNQPSCVTLERQLKTVQYSRRRTVKEQEVPKVYTVLPATYHYLCSELEISVSL